MSLDTLLDTDKEEKTAEFLFVNLDLRLKHFISQL